VPVNAPLPARKRRRAWPCSDIGVDVAGAACGEETSTPSC